MALASIRLRSSSRAGKGKWIFAALVALALAAYLVVGELWESAPGSDLSLTFGWAAAAVLVAVAALSARKRTMKLASRLGLGRSQAWLSVHIYGGGLFVVLVLLHSDFGLPDGWVTGWLLGLSLWTVAGGFLGRMLQRWIPRLMTSGLATEVIYERIPELVEEVRSRAATVAGSGSVEIQDFYARSMAKDIEAPRRRWIFFFDITGGVRERLRAVRYLRGKLSETEAGKLDELESLYRTKFEIDAHYTLQQTLRGWLWLHVPTSILLLVFLGLHLWGVLRY